MKHPKATRQRWPALLAAAAAALLLAGCSGPLGLNDSGNRSPVARLQADPEELWMGNQVTFDVAESYDPDGRIVHYLLDLGDGTTREFGQDDPKNVTHVYTRGGSYEVSLTVTDDGDKDEDDALSDEEKVTVVVNERRPVEASVLKSAILPNNATETMDIPFAVAEGADHFEVDVNVTNAAPAGDSTVTLAVLDPAGDVLDERQVDLTNGAAVPVEFGGLLTQAGTHTLRITADSGGAAVEGELRVLYG